MQLLKETRWVKIWQTEEGEFIDSKLAWAISPDAGAFMGDWDAADDAGRAEMRAAFAYYPYEFAADIARIVAHVAAGDAQMAAEMRESVFEENDFPDEGQMAFKRKLSEHLAGNPPPTELLLETPYYRAFLSEMGLQIDPKIEHESQIPPVEKLRALMDALEPGRHLARRAARTVAENPWLLRPAPGEMSLPGVDSLLD